MQPTDDLMMVCRRCSQLHQVADLQPDVSGHCCTTCEPRPTTPAPAQVVLATPDELADLLRHVQLQHLPYPMLLSVIRGDMVCPWLDIKVIRLVPDRDTGHVVKVQSLHRLPWDRGTTVAPAAVFFWVYGYALRDVVLHELAEAFHVDGERIYDPHRTDP